MSKDVIIIGAGLCGLHTAHLFQKKGINVSVLEGRQRLGGRILTQYVPTTNEKELPLELGPSWFWPHQKRINALCHDLELDDQIFEQAHRGRKIHEDKYGNISTADDSISMANSLRLQCGMYRLISSLHSKLQPETILLGYPVSHIVQNKKDIGVTCSHREQDHIFKGQTVVICAPTGVIANHVKFTPSLPPERHSELKTVRSWMASQAKALVVFETPVWRLSGFSGDVTSHLGPVVEWHDASPKANGPYVLLGFLGIPGIARKNITELKTQILQQLKRLFGIQTTSVSDIIIKDWAYEPYTALEDDKKDILESPSNTISCHVEPKWNSKLIWSGSETASMMKRNNGYLEGALEASYRAVKHITTVLNNPK